MALQNLAALQLPVEHMTINKGNFGNFLNIFVCLLCLTEVASFFLERIFGPLFSKVSIRYLTILDTPVKALEDYVFFGVNKTLEQLELLHTNLSQITPLSFGVNKKHTVLLIFIPFLFVFFIKFLKFSDFR